MKRIATIIPLSLMVLALCFCGEKKKEEVVQVKKTTLLPPGEFGIARHVWGNSVTAQNPLERIKAAEEVKDTVITLKGTEKATVETNKGNIVIELFTKDAPNTISNFIRLAETGFFDGLTWHRYEEGFLIQGGDPTGTGKGTLSYTIPFERNPRKHEMGSVAMARVGEDLNSASCHFYVCLSQQPHLDGSYCVFGKVIEGLDAVTQIRVGDTIRKVTISR